MNNTQSGYRVALIQGDGIGPELCASTQQVIEATRIKIHWVETPIGQNAKHSTGESLPIASLKMIKELKVALKAPLVAEKISGGIWVDDENESRHYPSINNAIRRELATYANVRPVRGFNGISGKHESMDLVIVREVSEGIYIGIENNPDPDTGHSIKQITRKGSIRIALFAFEYAKKFSRKKVTAVHKANVLHKTDGLFLSMAQEVSQSYPDILFDDQMIDAACYHVIKNPTLFDVLVMPNQYGDIFSDVAAGLAGSMGLAPGVNIGDDIAFFEASHGAAPDIAGKGIVNPISLILSGAMLLEYLNEHEAAGKIKGAVEMALKDPGNHTPDLGGKAITQQLTDSICNNIINIHAKH
jgi:isocitrate dehydrogenase (NAD+)